MPNNQWKLIKNKVIAGLVVAIVLSVVSSIIVLIGLPTRVSAVEKELDGFQTEVRGSLQVINANITKVLFKLN